jgi:hypothetical protein
MAIFGRKNASKNILDQMTHPKTKSNRGNVIIL